MSSQFDERFLRMTGSKVEPRCFKHKSLETDDAPGMHFEDLIEVSHCALSQRVLNLPVHQETSALLESALGYKRRRQSLGTS